MTAEKYKINSDEKKPTEVVESPKCLSFFSLFRFATWLELFLILIAILFSGVSAAMMPLIIITYGEFTTILVERAYNTGATSNTTLLHFFDGGKSLVNATQEEIRIEIENDSLAYLIWLMIFAGIQMVSGILFIDIFNFTALRQITRIRTKFFQSIICQEIGWYDKTSDYNFASRLTDDIDKIRDGISEKLGVFSSLVMSFIICIGISLGYGWKLSLVVLACVPVLIFCNHFVLKFQSSLTAKELDAYSSAGSVAEEVLSSIRTVVAFGGEEKESERYAKRLKNAQTAGKRKGAFSGIGEGILRMFFYICNAVAFWYGVSLILNDRDKEDREYTPAVLMIAFFGILVGAENLAKSAPFLEAFATARASATTIFDVIDRKSAIDPLSREGKIINHGIKGDIEFQDVDFYYPSRSDVKVLSRFNLKVQAGQTVALIGHSGCGKSTIVQLLQRFYDPNYGKVFMDNYDIKTMNIAWLRSNIAVVGQEPVLFGTTIENNIRYGRMDATRREIEDAAKSSGVHDFIMTLPEGYETQVGDLGSQLSGGQKQRIAIARALIQNPKILLLDEATSALDSQTEKQVQETLDRAAKGRTTIVVTHKLGSVRKADQIILIEKGVIKEQGTHFDLMKLQGKYYNMVRVDTIQSSLHHHDDEEDEEVKEIEGKEKLLKVFDRQESTKKLKVADKVEDVHSEEDDIGKVKVGAVCKRLLKMAKPEWGFLFIGAIGAAVVGMSYPAFAVLLGNIYGALSLTDPDDVNHETNISCICFLVVGAVVALCIFLQNFLFNTTGVILTTKLRQLAFRSMIGQEMGWFDQDVNSVGGLSARLSGDAANVRAAVGQPIGGIISALATLICGVAVAMSFSWKLALVCMCFVPLVLSSVIFEAKFMTSSMLKEKAAIEEATKIATTAIMNIRTVASLRQETHFISRFTAEIFGVERVVRRKLAFRGTVFSTGQSVPMFAYAIALYYGGILVAREGIHYQNLIRVSDSLIYAAMMMGQSLAFVPSLTAAFVAANRMFNVIDRKPLIQSPAHGEKKKQENESTINYKNIDFRYPTRTQMQVLNNMTLEVPSGKTVALVGPSGCGKSTCVQLLQRLYDPDRGRIFLNTNDISTDLKIPELRSKIGIVSQEPVLFDKTIAENIAYGDNNREVELTEIIEAAKIANIHSFIASLPLGYDTSLGAKGTQLSGGQKQRIAIARALVRNPKILILDEATSALDTESEKIVQQALDLAKSGRTCLVIAHRLSTIQNADLICVVHRGRIAEMGTHDELMSLNGLYFKLYNQLIV